MHDDSFGEYKQKNICHTEGNSIDNYLDKCKKNFQKSNRKIKPKIMLFSLQNTTFRDYHYPQYLPTNNTIDMKKQCFNLNSYSNQSKCQKKCCFAACYTLPINDKHIEITKSILKKQKLLEDQYYPNRERSITQPSGKILLKPPPPSRVSSAFHQTKRIKICQPKAPTLGLNIEKCKFTDRVKTSSPIYNNKHKKSVISNQLKCKPSFNPGECIKLPKKQSIPLDKWDYSDVEN